MATVADQGGAKDQRAAEKIGDFPRVMLALAGIALAAVTLVLWWAAPHATVTTTTEHTVQRSVAPATKHKRRPATRTTVHTTTKTTRVANGRIAKGKHVDPPGGTSLRSETLAIALISFGVLMLLFGAIGRVPSKLGFATATAEFPGLPREKAEEATQALVNATPDDVPPETVRVITRNYYDELAKRNVARPGLGRLARRSSDWPSGDDLQAIADQVVAEAQAPVRSDPS